MDNTPLTPEGETGIKNKGRNMPKIKVGDPQPVDCPKCKEKHGYQFADYMKIHYTTIHEANGDHWGGGYSEGGRMLNEGSTPQCANCGKKLPFKLDRQ